ncbi:MAG: LptF/LptG family permease [Acidobacteriaceae bacterium]|nr:LptF/LptG family permease [Acidobacteriaceae bacterium]MBV9781825.1 LptF/LptG family permease [Acidobacteriaceae bacterium]
MRILSRTIFREVLTSAVLGTLLFVFVLFLRTIERLSVLLVRSSAPIETIAKLLLYALPSTIPFALPLGVLVGILIGLSRMSSDSEITAMRASGISSLTVARPVLLFAFLAMCVTAVASLWLTPLSLHLDSNIARGLAATELTGNIEPRIFDEQFPNTVLYVGDVLAAGKQVIWQQVFMADVTPPDELQQQGKNRGEGPRIIVAEQAIPHPDAAHNRIILDMTGVRSSERDKDGNVITTAAPLQVEALQAQKPADLQLNKTEREMDTGPLYKRVYRQHDLSREDHVDAEIELHQRFVLPFACVLLASVGVPLGISSRKGGKSAAFVLTVLLAFLYYMGLISLIGLAKKGSLPVPLAVWTPNGVFAIAGVILLSRLEKPGDRDVVAAFRNFVRRIPANIMAFWPVARTRPTSRKAPGFGFRPMLIDVYVLNGFLFYFGILLLALVALIEVFTFFELLGDMIKNDIAMSMMLDYLAHLAPKLIYDLTPIGTLVASLICFGILTKYNEVTAFKAGGISVHRLAMPVLVVSLFISVLLFGFDHYYLPEANRRQEMLRSEIKKKPVQTYLRPDRQWVYGEGSRIYNYRYLDPHQAIMSKVNVYELDPKSFRIVHQISADRARWEPSLKTWVFQNGMSQTIRKSSGDYHPFYGASASFPQLTEPPSWFVKEEKEYKEMNFEELGHYIRDLKASGLDTTPLQVQYYKKFAVPLFALIMAILSIPFAFVAGNRGAMTGVGISFGIAIAYWTVGTLFEQIGDLNQLPAVMAAWSPDLVFSLAGLYFMARMKT